LGKVIAIITAATMPGEPGGEAGEVVEGRHDSHALAECVQQQLKKCTYGCHFAQQICLLLKFKNKLP
jgi:hypothetical protein